MIILRALRAISFCEGVSFLVLLLVAMPLKHIWGWPLAVKWVGWAHGGLFITLGVLTLWAVWRASLPIKTACLVGVASLVPTGPFFMDRVLRSHEHKLMAKAARARGCRPQLPVQA